MTEVQARTIPALLTGRDVLGAARTGGASVRVGREAARMDGASGWEEVVLGMGVVPAKRGLTRSSSG